MKHASAIQALCPFCQKKPSSECLHCSHTIKVNEMSEQIQNNRQDPDATERVAQPSATTLYQQVLQQATLDTDATERVAQPSATALYQQALQQATPDTSARDETTPVAPEPEKQPSARARKSPPAPQVKRSRRRFLGISRLLADLVLLLLLLGCSGLTVESHLAQNQLEQRAGAIRQQSLQFQTRLLQLQQAQQQQQLQTKAQTLVKTFNQEVQSWGQAHLYRDSYDKHSYTLDSGYAQAGIGTAINNDLAAARTSADFQDVVDETQNALFNLQMMEADYTDHTSYKQTHATDLDLLNYYQLSQKTVLLVSSVEQVMRVYQQGKLVRSFYVTTGRYEKPSLPGIWSVLDRRSPVIFTSGDPPGSPYWFPNTPINYAILYHYGGFFVHDAPWRGSFGPGTEFPHQDASGNTPYNFDGSHGCVNLSEADASWVYHNTDWNTVVVIY